MSVVKADVIVMGSGIAGCTTAIRCAQAGMDVALVTKAHEPDESNTRYAQGGIVAEGISDSPRILVSDIMKASSGTANPEAARVVAGEGPRLVREILLDEMGIAFDLDEFGDIDRTREAAHSRRRIFHAKDATGHAIEVKMIAAARAQKRVKLYTHQISIDLITRSHHSRAFVDRYSADQCVGAYVLDERTMRTRTFLAPAVVIATGGIGQIYLHTTNPALATGDGVAMAARAGCPIVNAEFVQFHPTAFFHRDAPRYLITEAIRGEGGRLVDAAGKPFMQRYDPAADLAPRDVVARSIHEELARTGAPCVFLDIANHARPGFDIKAHFPNIEARCRDYGVDITRDPIPVVPAAHYFCGGVRTSMWGRTDLPGLWAVGEVACTGLHGANRLASTSLLEGLVFGVRAAQDIAAGRMRLSPALARSIPPWDDTGLSEEGDPLLISQDWLTIKTTMWNYAGIVRTFKRLARARSDLDYLSARVHKFYRETKLSRPLIELRNGMITARIVTQSALSNRESVGCHFRKD